MTVTVHPSAIVDDGAQIGEGSRVTLCSRMWGRILARGSRLVKTYL